LPKAQPKRVSDNSPTIRTRFAAQALIAAVAPSTGEQGAHRGRSVPDQPSGAGPLAVASPDTYIADVCDNVNYGMEYHA
jgi:hypothetical protein